MEPGAAGEETQRDTDMVTQSAVFGYLDVSHQVITDMIMLSITSKTQQTSRYRFATFEKDSFLTPNSSV